MNFFNLCNTDPLVDYQDSKAWVLALWWAIWKARSEFIFKSHIINPFKILKVAKSVFDGARTYVEA